MKNHKIERDVHYSDLAELITKYEIDGYEVAGITYREYHYDVIFKKVQTSEYKYMPFPYMTEPIHTITDKEPYKVTPDPNGWRPYCSGLTDTVSISSSDNPSVVHYAYN